MHVLSRVIVTALALFVSQAAVAEEWIVARVTGTAWLLRDGAAPVQVAAGMPVPLGATVATTPQGRAMLIHGRDTMMVGPSTKIAIPYKPDRGMKATVIQQVGEIDLAIEKRRRPHFSVQTPFLAAVVKGTEFTVSVSSVAAEVGVKRGLVSIADFATGQRADLGPGQQAAVSPGQKLGLQVAGLGTAPKVHAGRPRQPSIPAEPQAAAPGQSGAAHAANGGGHNASPESQGSGSANRNGGNSASAGSNGSGGNGNQGGSNGNSGGSNGGNGGGSNSGGGNANSGNSNSVGGSDDSGGGN
ncbi:MAG TPA: FecR domain-containing protein, partial [Propylenella sp.]|nr:FecR domain-containing protein [Propylenella sp.]